MESVITCIDKKKSPEITTWGKPVSGVEPKLVPLLWYVRDNTNTEIGRINLEKM